MQKLNILEVYAGCGGTSALEFRGDVEGVHVEVDTAWAVDSEPAMAITFRVNFPHCHVGNADLVPLCALNPNLYNADPSRQSLIQVWSLTLALTFGVLSLL